MPMGVTIKTLEQDALPRWQDATRKRGGAIYGADKNPARALTPGKGEPVRPWGLCQFSADQLRFRAKRVVRTYAEARELATRGWRLFITGDGGYLAIRPLGLGR